MSGGTAMCYALMAQFETLQKEMKEMKDKIKSLEEQVEELKAGKCEDCGNECEDLDDKLCHKCYHASVPSGECWCEYKNLT